MLRQQQDCYASIFNGKSELSLADTDPNSSIPYKAGGPDLLRPYIDSGMHLDAWENKLYVGLAFERESIGPQAWDRFLVTSANDLYVVDNDNCVIYDESQPEVAVRRCHPLQLTGLMDENRMSVRGLGLIITGHPAPIDLHKRLTDKIREYVLLPEEWQYQYVATWIVGTYLFKLFPVFPFLLAMSKHPGSGKSKLLALLERLCFNATKTNGITAAGLRRMSDSAPGTLIIDEFESISRDKLMGTDINEVLNSKFDSDSRVTILVPTDKRGGWSPQQFKLFSPVVIAKLSAGGASATIIDRSIIIRMQKLKGKYNQDHPRYDNTWSGLRDDLYRWSLRNWQDVWVTFRDNPAIRLGLNRKGEIWRVSLSVAKVFLPKEHFQMLLSQASEPDLVEEQDLPGELAVIVEGLDDLKSRAVSKVKVSDFKKSLGSRLAPHLLGDKAFIAALEELAHLEGFTLANHSKGGTKYIFFHEPNVQA